MIEHNVVVVDGLEYKAVIEPDVSDVLSCEICSLNNKECMSCTKEERNDGLNVIFKRHYRPRHNELPIRVIEL